MTGRSASRTRPVAAFYGRLLAFLLLWVAILFLPAGTLAFWEAWVVLGILAIPMAVAFPYWNRQDPEAVERRAQRGEKEAEQQVIVKALSLAFVLTFLIPGFDRRYGWSAVPTAMVVAADLLLLIGYGICFRAVWENRFAARTVQVEGGQSIISSGLYAVVRHPMYLGVLLMCVALPLALGSHWAMIPALAIVPVLVARIRNEEKVLSRDLAGYPGYLQRTRYRLLPGIW